ncbi:DUF1249 domain-containing protein [Colwellia polaris]|jgi:uncharacterized protein YqiB (DUF1249 family)|uniref:DUF1249 domain-containing protein n=1 Tax=Colwellia polaris TaxID=326537 RepID=UPI000A16D31A|nr:DUF1249 domain-containing protein [Colwellia polaris]|tara:strand:- start:1437 stop:1892 length:456 start_codon:yes stop_codon:yes gene_type:complete
MPVVEKKYRPHLPTLMALCEINYMLLLRILADKEQVGEQRCFFISDFLSYRITVNEVTKYTTLITINQEANIRGYNLTELFRPKMVVRLYHDARMAEVISNQDVQQIKPRYDYPNEKMHLPDEKQQVNYFLKEWLQLCLKFGQVNFDIPRI